MRSRRGNRDPRGLVQGIARTERKEDPREKRNPVPIVVRACDEVPRGQKHSLVDEHSRDRRRDALRQANRIGTTNDDERADVLGGLSARVLLLRVRDRLRRWGKRKAGEDQRVEEDTTPPGRGVERRVVLSNCLFLLHWIFHGCVLI